MKLELPRIAVVSTGGTIAEKTDSHTGGAVPAVSGKELVAAVPGLAVVAEISVHQLCNIDSSQMSPQIWAELSQKVNELLADKDVDGVVVTHGTDTMAEGAYFLDLTTRSNKPVVFTGAMNDASSADPDGPGNLMNAVIQAASADARNWGVTVTLNRYINSARTVRKTQTTNMQTFMSGEKGYLGYISGKKIYRINERVHRRHLPLPAKLPKVVYISMYAGADGSLVRHAVDSGAKGLVIDGVGAGNVNKDVYEAIKYGLSKKVAVVISSSVYFGSVEPIYGGPGGGKTLSDNGCILAGNLKGHKARLLLILGLANYGNDYEKLKELFAK
ncbi:asparaginase [Maridesulfovibrio sp.]|uniref:asparaginase n=1 Tax=Maridesulfovibrio sp. TaxID=2795000 RepID=UPI003BACB8EA